jgi:hypothetical protein
MKRYIPSVVSVFFPKGFNKRPITGVILRGKVPKDGKLLYTSLYHFSLTLVYQVINYYFRKYSWEQLIEFL